MKSFKNGWAKCKAHSHTYGVSYLHLYENDLIQMNQEGARNSSSKMSTGKMRENLLSLYTGQYLIPCKTVITHFIGNLTQTNKKMIPLHKNLLEVERLVMQRDLGIYLLNELIDKDPTEKQDRIYHSLIKNFGDTLTDDLLKDSIKNNMN